MHAINLLLIGINELIIGIPKPKGSMEINRQAPTKEKYGNVRF